MLWRKRAYKFPGAQGVREPGRSRKSSATALKVSGTKRDLKLYQDVYGHLVQSRDGGI